jgi:hypothetical protein
MTRIASAELTKPPFTLNHYLEQGGALAALAYMRMVRLVYFYDDKTGDEGFRPAKDAPISVDALLHFPLHGTIFDNTWARPSLSTALKSGASTRYFDTTAALKARGATLISPLKETGFTFKRTKRIMEEERKKKNMKVVYGERVTALFEGTRPHLKKESGFQSSRTASDLKKAKNRKDHLARRAAIEKKDDTLTFP